MKLSQISADRTMDILSELTPYISNIAEDEQLLKVLKNKIQYDENNKEEIKEKGAQLGISNVLKLVPLLFKNHKEDIQNILAIMDNVTLKEIKEENIIKNMARIKELFEDDELMSFFTSLDSLEALK